jgi:hypothetical protein
VSATVTLTCDGPSCNRTFCAGKPTTSTTRKRARAYDYAPTTGSTSRATQRRVPVGIFARRAPVSLNP